MNQQEKSEMYKRDGFENEYYKAIESNFHKAEKKDQWVVENYNSLSRDFSERLSWLAGIGIGLIPLIFQYIKPNTTLEKHIIIFVLLFLLASIIMGGVDFLVSLKFWDTNASKNREAIKNWYKAMIKIKEKYPNSGEDLYEKAREKNEDLNLNSNIKVSSIYIILQVIFVSLAISLQVLYLILKI